MPIKRPRIKPSHLTELTRNFRFQAEDSGMSGLEETQKSYCKTIPFYPGGNESQTCATTHNALEAAPRPRSRCGHALDKSERVSQNDGSCPAGLG